MFTAEQQFHKFLKIKHNFSSTVYTNNVCSRVVLKLDEKERELGQVHFSGEALIPVVNN